MVKVKCVKTAKSEAEKTRKKLEEGNALDKDYEAVKDDSNVYFPVKKELSSFEVIEKETKLKKRKPSSLREALKGKLEESEMKKLFTSFDIIGDIALIEVPDELLDRKEKIGKAVMKVHPNVSTVCRKKDKTQGKFRIRPVEVVAGEKKTETVHKESGVRIKLDLNKVYFNPRLSHEREIISKKVEGKEEVGYLFAGVGPFGLVIAKENPQASVKAVELNPAAYEYLEENIDMNGLGQQMQAIHKDVKELRGHRFDRVIMVMPLTSEEYLDAALRNSKEDAVMHYYSIGEEPDYFEKPLRELEEKIGGENFEVLEKREVLSYSPSKKEVAIDLKLV